MDDAVRRPKMYGRCTTCGGGVWLCTTYGGMKGMLSPRYEWMASLYFQC